MSNHEEPRQREGVNQLSHQHLLPIVSTLASEIVPNLVRELGRLAEDGANESSMSVSKMSSLCQHEPLKPLSNEPLVVLSELCIKACLEMEAEPLKAFFRDWIAKGLDIESFYLDVIPLAIRSLHEKWEEDQVSFLDVTRATWSIKHLLLELSPDFIKPDAQSFVPQLNRFQAFICTSPGSEHTLGPLLVSQYLQRKGWLVWPGIDHTEKAVLELVSKNWVDLFCVSISVSSDIPRLQSWIQKVRSKSKNTSIQCFVGGPLMALEPQLVSQIGADAGCVSPRELHLLGSQLVKVHRKVRKLNAQSVEALSQVTSRPAKSVPKRALSPLRGRASLQSSTSSDVLGPSGFSSSESSNAELFNPQGASQSHQKSRG